MVIIYGTRTVFKREGPVGTSVCPNCRHNVMHTLLQTVKSGNPFLYSDFRPPETAWHYVRKLRYDYTGQCTGIPGTETGCKDVLLNNVLLI